MEEFTASQILLAALASVGGIGGLISAIVKIDGLVKARAKRLADGRKEELHLSVEGRRLELEATEKKEAREQENCWKLVDAKNQVIADLKKEIEDLEGELAETVKGAKLGRKTINQIYANLDAMKNELKHLNMMIWDDEKTNVFMTRFEAVQKKIEETENLLP